MDLNSSALEVSKKRKAVNKKAALVLITLISIIIVSASVAALLFEEVKTDPDTISAYVDNGEDGEGDNFISIDSDYSAKGGTRSGKAIEGIDFWTADQTLVGVEIGDIEESEVSDGEYYSVISQQYLRSSSSDGSSDSLVEYNGTLEGDGDIDQVVYEDDVPIKNVAASQPGEVKKLYQVHRLRGANLQAYFTIPELQSKYLTVEDYVRYSNFHAGGHYPSFLIQMGVTIRLRFANASEEGNALPLEYFVHFYNFFTEEWDVYRSEVVDVLVYALGIYQEDYLDLGTNFQFQAYFDPADRLTMLIKVGVVYMDDGNGGYEELSIDKIAYSYSSESETIKIDCSPSSSSGAVPGDWASWPDLTVEGRSNADAGALGPDDVVRATGYDGVGREYGIRGGSEIPTGTFDTGVLVNTSGHYMYDEVSGDPTFDLYILSEDPLEIDIDSLFITYYINSTLLCPSRWNVIEGASDLTWEIFIPVEKGTRSVVLRLPSDYRILRVITPFGEDAAERFSFTPVLEIGEAVISVYGRGTYQVVAEAPNYITQSAISGSSDYEGSVSEVSYTNPVYHYTEIIDYEALKSEGKQGNVTVTFIVQSGGFVYYNSSYWELPDDGREKYIGTATFPGAAVGVADVIWVWTNGESVGYRRGVLVVLGSSEDPPFIKVFTPESGGHVNDESILYVAVIATDPERVGFALDNNPAYAELKKGYFDVEGVSSLLEDYTYYSTLPVGIFEHETIHRITVRAYEGLNNRKTTREIPIEVDTDAGIKIESIAQAYDDEPTSVRYSADPDTVVLNVYLDEDRIGTFKEGDITGKLKIPKLSSGTYYLRLEARDELGNYRSDSDSFFVLQRNQTVLGTIWQWISDFFKILMLMILSFIASLGIIVYTRKRREKCPKGQEMRDGECRLVLEKCPKGQEIKNGRCEVILN